jgi:1-acyl-sn-glycerol-3-phosphate acyltransferase
MSHLLNFENGVYRSPPQTGSPLARLFPSWAFHSRFISIVWKASVKAKRGVYDDHQWALSSLAIIRALEKVGVRFEITGIDHLRTPDTPCLVVGNHMSTLETGVLPSLIQPIRKVTFVVKEGLLEYPVFKHVMRSRDPIPVTQTNPRVDFKRVMEEGAKRLASGISLVIFPQGARRPVFDVGQFNTIAVKLAQRADVPIVPLALDTRAWGLGRRLTDFGRIDPSKPVRFAFGEPLWVRGRGTDEHQAIVDFIRTRLRTWGAPELHGPRRPFAGRAKQATHNYGEVR